jgi:hypothetical protein
MIGLVVICIATFVNIRGPMVATSQDAFVQGNFRFFNPCTSTNSKGLVATAWRYSNRCYCQDRWLPLVHGADQNSIVKLSIGGSYESAITLDTSPFGLADGYEDPRIAWINDSTLFIVFVKFVKNPDTSDICVGLVDVGADRSFTMTRTRMYTSTQRQKNWIAKINDSKHIDLYARIESPQIVYHLSTADLIGHSVIHIPSCPLKSTWRGSSFFCQYKNGHVALLHKRLVPALKTRFMPSYEYALCYLDGPSITIGPTFHLTDEKGFVYASGIEVHGTSIRVSAGISDCYSQQMIIQ